MTNWTLNQYRQQRRIDEAFDPVAEGYDPCAVMFEGVVMTKHEKAELMRERRLKVERDARLEKWFRRLVPVLITIIAIAIGMIWNLGAGLLVSALVAVLVLKTRRRLIRQGAWTADSAGLWE